MLSYVEIEKALKLARQLEGEPTPEGLLSRALIHTHKQQRVMQDEAIDLLAALQRDIESSAANAERAIRLIWSKQVELQAILARGYLTPDETEGNDDETN